MKKTILKFALIAIFFTFSYFMINEGQYSSHNMSQVSQSSSEELIRGRTSGNLSQVSQSSRLINKGKYPLQGEKKMFEYYVSGSAPKLYPTDTFFGLLWYSKDKSLEIPKRYPYQGEWGSILSTHILNQEYFPMPTKLDMVYLSLVEKKFYSIEKILPTEKMEKLWNQTDKEIGHQLFTHIVVGMAPYGGVALWFVGYRKSILIVVCIKLFPFFIPFNTSISSLRYFF